MNFVWSASYQLLPSGEYQVERASLYSGNGRSDCATEALQGYPAYGSLIPAATAVVEQTWEVNSVRVLGLVRSSPNFVNCAGEMALRAIKPRASSQTPRLPT